MSIRRVLAISILAFTGAAESQTPTGDATYVPFGKALEIGRQNIKELRVVVSALRRGTGRAEVHENESHLFIVLEGEAVVVVGGTLVGSTQVSPGEFRGSGIEGGQSFRITKGDMLMIPA